MELFRTTSYLVLLILLTLIVGKTKKCDNHIRSQFDDAYAMIEMWIIIIGFYILTIKH